MKQTKTIFSIFLLSILPLFALASFDLGKIGKHNGEWPDLEYSVEYLSPSGVTTVDGSGIAFSDFWGNNFFEPTILPAKYFGDWPLYFTGETLHFRMHIKNTGKRTFENLQVIVWQEFLNPDGGSGEMINPNEKNNWFLRRLGPGEEIIFDADFFIPMVDYSGLDQTHLQIIHWPGNNPDSAFGGGRVIVDAPQAGIWCPTRN